MPVAYKPQQHRSIQKDNYCGAEHHCKNIDDIYRVDVRGSHTTKYPVKQILSCYSDREKIVW
jgi:hypothetical protein